MIKYGIRFGNIYEEFGNFFESFGDFKIVVRVYEFVFYYYKIVGSEMDIRCIVGKFFDIYGEIIENFVESKNFLVVVDVFYVFVKYVRVIFGYDFYYFEIMEMVVKNYEKVSKFLYFEGDFDGIVMNFVKVQYVYMFCENMGRVKFVGINVVRMFY